MALQWLSRYPIACSKGEQECAGYFHHLAGGLLATMDTSGADLICMIAAAITSKSGRLKQMVP